MSVVIILAVLLFFAYVGDRIIGRTICSEKHKIVMKKLQDEQHD
jgi:hypothetical protein